MARRSFSHRTETFGLDTDESWALDALRLVFHVPRAYAPLVKAWDARHPGTKKALERLVDMGFVEYQGPVVVNTRTSEIASRPSAPLPRYRTTAKGHRLHELVKDDVRVLEDTFTRLTPNCTAKVARLIDALDLEDSHARYGLSVPHATALSGLAERSGRWWVRHLEEAGYVRKLEERYADTREVVPAHWRVTRLLCRQLSDVIDAFPERRLDLYRVEFRLKRSRFLSDIDPARVGISGATDFDHDVECQRILAAMSTSERCAIDGIFTVEPRITLGVHDHKPRPWRLENGAPGTLFYQPDAEIREVGEPGQGLLRSVVEYERFQTRRDAWNHIERFLGYLHLVAHPSEDAVLRFVVDSESRVRSYVQLIEAFADHSLDHTERMPRNNVTLAVSSVQRVLEAADPLDPRAWFRIDLPANGSDTASEPVLHAADDSPYDDYFSRVSL
jgi:hypothetical protein